MGWFDGDSSDDEEEEGKAPQKSNNNNLAGGVEDEDEEDPLDAYMKSLGNPSTAAEASTSKSNKKPGRLDLENEEEATSHWKTSSSRTDNQNDSDDNDVDNDGFVKQSAVAKRKLQQTFHKAGAYHAGDDDDDDNDDTAKNSSSKQSKHVDIQLDKVDHNQMHYNAFDKVFWNPITQSTSTTTSTTRQRDQAWREEHGITLHDSRHHQALHSNSASTSNTSVMSPIYEFSQLHDVMDETLLQHIHKMGYHHPTPVQAQTLPIALGGWNVLVTAPTGSGKSLAYLWPMVVHVCAQDHLGANETGPIGLVLVPTRELALQVQTHAQTMLTPVGGSSLVIIGGMGKYPLTQQLRQKGGVDIVVATPGRLLDVLATKQQALAAATTTNKNKITGLSLERTTMVVLDECDRLLHMGFTPQVTQILDTIRPDRQTLMLSATMSHRIEKVAQQWLCSHDGRTRGIGYHHNNNNNNSNNNSYIRIAVGRTGQASLHVQQHVMVVPSDAAKLSWLQQIVPLLASIGRTLIFCATKEGCETLANQLRDSNALPSNITCVTLHGDKHQTDRTAALRQFVKQKQKKQKQQQQQQQQEKQQQQQQIVLIATDVASRGLDIPNVETVINYDPPKNLDVFVHRVGRAGRLSAHKKDNNQDNNDDDDDDDQQQPNEGAAYTILRTPKDADFGHVLLGAMERENRPIPEELRQLAKLSRQQRGSSSSNQNVQSRNRWNKAGLGSHHNTTDSAAAAAATSHASVGDTSTHESDIRHYYGPSTTTYQQPSQKKSRWS